MSDSVLFYSVPFALSFVVALILAPLTRKLAHRWNAIDVQNTPRKTHPSGAVPLLGGLAVIGSFVLVSLFSWSQGWLTDLRIQHEQLLAVLVGSVLIALIGVADDKYGLKPGKLIIIPVIVSVLAVYGGIRVGYVTNPFEAGTGPFGLSLFYFSSNLSLIFSFLWILGMMYTVKFLDGLDGLVTGVGAIGAIILFIVSLFWDVPLSGTSVLALIMAGSLLGFLPYHWHPAKQFFGEGSLFIGFMLGVLSIISGGKIATALLIMGIPILDVVWVIVKRLVKLTSPFKGDRNHLHFQLLDNGFSHRQTVLILFAVTAFFGTLSIFLQSKQKVIALGTVIVIMILLALLPTLRERYNKQDS